MFVTGLVLAAGSSRRLGEPKQLLPYAGSTLLGASLDVARQCGFDQLILTLGAAAEAVRSLVDLQGVEVVDSVQHEDGCSSSIRSALAVVDERADGLVLMLGDQPRVLPSTVRQLVAEAGAVPMGVCRYANGRGHPFWLSREVFPGLEALHGDKGVWRLLESGRYPVADVEVAGQIPLDVDTREDYSRLLEQGASDLNGRSD
jgi:molybdenum cofactor cytidylyltransferase